MLKQRSLVGLCLLPLITDNEQAAKYPLMFETPNSTEPVHPIERDITWMDTHPPLPPNFQNLKGGRPGKGTGVLLIMATLLRYESRWQCRNQDSKRAGSFVIIQTGCDLC
jgi:hypothetical protein